MRPLMLVLLFDGGGFARPALDAHGVVNAVSYFPPGYLAMGLAQGAMIAIFRTGLGPEGLAQANGYPLSPTLGGASVQIKPFSGAVVDAIPVYVSARQLGVVIPSRTRGSTDAPCSPNS